MSAYKKAFITGAGGFIGRALAARLRGEGVEVVGMDANAVEPWIVAGNVAEDGNWLEALDGADLVIHTAAIVSMAGDRDAFNAVNVGGTRRVLDAAIGAGAKRFVHFSSTAVYSDRFPPDVDETYPVRTSGNLYVDTKIASEQVVLAAHAADEMEVTVIRPGDVYGPGSRPWITEPVEMMKKRQFMLPDGGRGIFSPIYIDDLVEGTLAAAESPAGSGQIFNISCAVGVSNMEYFSYFARMIGAKKIPSIPSKLMLPAAALGYRMRKVLPVSDELNAQTVRFLLRENSHSIAKARELLGWEPKVPLAEGMSECEAWLRSEGILAPAGDN